MKISVAFYKKQDSWFHKIVSWWTKSPYIHAGLTIPEKNIWISISPFLNSKVSARTKEDASPEEWDFIDFDITEEQYETILDFYNETKGCKYDWIGMILSQFLPFVIKRRERWYCSEWIAYALRIACVLNWRSIRLYDRNDLSPAILYDLIKNIEQ